MGPLSQVSVCPLPTTAKAQGDLTHPLVATGSLALALGPTPRCHILRCPIHKARTIRDRISRDLHSQLFMVTLWVSFSIQSLQTEMFSEINGMDELEVALSILSIHLFISLQSVVFTNPVIKAITIYKNVLKLIAYLFIFLIW